jgi:hypothetical protein
MPGRFFFDDRHKTNTSMKKVWPNGPVSKVQGSRAVVSLDMEASVPGDQRRKMKKKIEKVGRRREFI